LNSNETQTKGNIKNSETTCNLKNCPQENLIFLANKNEANEKLRNIYNQNLINEIKDVDKLSKSQKK